MLSLPTSVGALSGWLMLLAALGLALAVDGYLGEPPARWHPVVWIGNALNRLAPWVLPKVSVGAYPVQDAKAFVRGYLAWLALAALVLIVSGALQWALLQLPLMLAALLLGLALKPLLAWRMLRAEVQSVEAALTRSLAEGRERLSWLVSRDVSALTETQVRESAIETLAENLSDSVVAPIFWFLLLGLPGAALYRLANTADAMWGYRGTYKGQHWEWAGKWTAWADDALSWLPARITALLLLAVAAFGGVRAAVASLIRLQREARRTPSPNSGWPMAAMALALGVGLQKPEVYALNGAGRAPQEADMARALNLASKTVAALASLALVAMVCIVFMSTL